MNTDKIFAEQIANEYTQKDNSKVNALRKLDRLAKLPANIFAYTFGVLSTLVLGVGMCLSMGVIGGEIPGRFAVGVAVGVTGMLCVGLNYPIYKRILEKGKRKYAFEIIQLAKEIGKE